MLFDVDVDSAGIVGTIVRTPRAAVGDRSLVARLKWGPTAIVAPEIATLELTFKKCKRAEFEECG